MQSNFCTFPMCSKVGSSNVPVPFPVFVVNSDLKYRKILFERTSGSNCDTSMSIPSGDTLFPLAHIATVVLGAASRSILSTRSSR